MAITLNMNDWEQKCHRLVMCWKLPKGGKPKRIFIFHGKHLSCESLEWTCLIWKHQIFTCSFAHLSPPPLSVPSFLFSLFPLCHLLSPFLSSCFFLFPPTLSLSLLFSSFNLPVLLLFLFLLPFPSPFQGKFSCSLMLLALWFGAPWETQKSSWIWKKT